MLPGEGYLPTDFLTGTLVPDPDRGSPLDAEWRRAGALYPLPKMLRFPMMRGALVALLAGIVACERADVVTSPLDNSPPGRLIAQCTYVGDPTCTDSLPATLGQLGVDIPGINPTMCADTNNYPDSDVDGMNDVCELKLAEAFAPWMNQTTLNEYYDPSEHRIIGDYYHAVRAPICTQGTCDDVRIAYMPAYYMDEGKKYLDGFIVPGGRIDGGHPGDSEFIMIDVGFDSGVQRYVAHAYFLSAHCGATVFIVSTAPACVWRTPGELVSDGLIRGGAPQVYVARGTNANYPSLSVCQGGSDGLDYCETTNVTWVHFPIDFSYNVGYVGHSLGNVRARRYPSWASDWKTENFWDLSVTFGGWQPIGILSGQTGYASILYDFGFFRGYTGGGGGGTGDTDPCSGEPAPPISGYYSRVMAPGGLRATRSSTARLAPTGARRLVAVPSC